MINSKNWKRIFGFARRKENDEIEQKHNNLALAIQEVTEDIVIAMAKEAKRLSNSDNLCLAGGVALNCVSNSKLKAAGVFKNIFIQPAAGDAGAALGAALSVSYQYFDINRYLQQPDSLKGSYLGPEYSDKQIVTLNEELSAVYTKYDDAELYSYVAKELANGKVVGWFQGRMEFGPRALGNRSILADPRNLEMQKKLNLKIKYREGFRPFAPSVLVEDANKYFDLSLIHISEPTRPY